MKLKIILFSLCITLLATPSFAQNNDSSPSSRSSTTKSDGVVRMADGRPYSEYKAEQTALKQQQAANIEKQKALMAPFKAQITKQAAQAKANKGKPASQDAYNAKQREERLKQKKTLKEEQKLIRPATTP